VGEFQQGLIPLIVFGAAILFVFGLYMLWAESRESGAEKIKSRIRRLSAGSAEDAEANRLLSLAKEEVGSPLDRALLELPRLHKLDRFLEQAGVSYGPASALALSLFIGFVGAIISMLLFRSFSLLPLIVGYLAGIAILWIILANKRAKRKDELVKQIPDTLDFFARSLRAGNPFAGAMKSASEEMQQPLAGELEITFDELNYGLEFEECMQNLATRIDTEEIRLFVTAILVQKSTGGNLAELMNRIAALLRERKNTKGEIQIQAAEMKTSARILIALPFVIAGLLQLVNPTYIPILFETPGGRMIIGAQGVLMVIGYFVINRMVNFRI
jgi:tight adherence protein B